MSDTKYTPQVGDRVRLRGWEPEWVQVIAIERGHLFGFDDVDRPVHYVIGLDWVKVPEPVFYPDRWINVYTDGIGVHALTRERVDELADGYNRIAVIHLAADGTLTLHPVERES